MASTPGPTPSGSSVLILFGGESLRDSSPQSTFRSAGWSADSWDLADSRWPDDPIELHDLSSDSVWNWFSHDVQGSLHQFILMIPLSSTFPGSVSGRRRDPFRSPEFPMGIPGVLKNPEVKERIRLET